MLILRGTDRHGSGDYGAPRGSRRHNGLDLACSKDAVVCSPAAGAVTKIGWPYADSDKNHYRYVEVTDAAGYKHRVFYIEPTVEAGDFVTTRDTIGIAQGITDTYPGIIDHVHYEVMDGGDYLDPWPFLTGG